MWTLGSLADDIRLSNCTLDATTVSCATRVLFGEEGVARPAGDARPLYLRRRSTLEAIRVVMPIFDSKGLVGDEFLQEDGEESAATEGDGAGGGEGS